MPSIDRAASTSANDIGTLDQLKLEYFQSSIGQADLRISYMALMTEQDFKFRTDLLDDAKNKRLFFNYLLNERVGDSCLNESLNIKKLIKKIHKYQKKPEPPHATSKLSCLVSFR